MQITGERVAVLTDMAIKADDIDEAAAEEARQKAEARLAQKLSNEEAATVHAAIAHATTQINVKRRAQKITAAFSKQTARRILFAPFLFVPQIF